MCMEIDTSKIHVMGSEPLPGVEPDDIREWCRVHTSVQDMIDAYAVTHNKAWWIEENDAIYEMLRVWTKDEDGQDQLMDHKSPKIIRGIIDFLR